MTPVSSASGMNSMGPINPRTGCRQRMSASTPVGDPEQLVGDLGPEASRRDPDAAADLDLCALDQERDPERIDDALGDGHRLRQVRCIVEEHGELVAAEAGRQVVSAKDALETCRDLREEAVAGRMTERIVDDLEV